ncbi:MAG: SURF1 family protein [Woeseiaceae bacterium]
MNTKSKKSLPTWLPLVVGTLLVIQFAGLGAWQISRGMEKRASQAAFSDETGFASWQDGMDVRPYQRLKATGRYDNDHQFLLENIILNSRYGYYVITPLIGEADEPVLLVNRGWVAKGDAPLEVALLDVPASRVTVRGRAGSLPRAGYKMGTAINPANDWPKPAVYPSKDEIAVALGRPVQSVVLLMDHEEQHGFLRQWVPSEFGPGKHFAYAFQWFAMAVVLAALLTWNYRKKRFAS